MPAGAGARGIPRSSPGGAKMNEVKGLSDSMERGERTVVGQFQRVTSGLVVATASGLLLGLMETAGILSQHGAPSGSSIDILVTATWLALPYAATIAMAALMVAFAVPAPGLSRGLAAGIGGGVVLLLWIRTLANLGEGSAAYPVLELLVVGVACAGGMAAGMLAARPAPGGGRTLMIGAGMAGLAALVASSRNIPGPFGRPGPPAGFGGRLLWAVIVAAAVAAVIVMARALASRGEGARWLVRGLAAASAVGWVIYCGSGFVHMLGWSGSEPRLPEAGAVEPGRPNVILISIDTLRADHLSCYGYGRPTTPGIDGFAASAVLYRNASSTASFTLPAHASMMTGQFPSSHGATYQNRDPGSFTLRGIRPGSPMLAEILRERGYDTAAFVSGPLLSRHFGFDRGFRIYDDRYDRLQSARERLFARSFLFRVLYRLGVFSDRDLDAQRTAGEVNPLMDDWLAKRRGSTRPFFLFVHYWDPHGPYAPPAPLDERPDGTPIRVDYDMDRLLIGDYTYTPEALADLITLYDGEIQWVDRHVAALLDRLRANRLLDGALVILTADHGESFGEHDHWEHSRVLYEDVLHVPFIMKLPGERDGGRVVEDVVAQPTDILPTVLAEAGIQTPPEVEGRNLLAFLEPDGDAGASGQAESHVRGRGLAFAELDRNVDWPERWGARFDRDLVSARTLRYKYIHSSTGEEELYDLRTDPGELTNLASVDPSAASAMRQLVEAWRKALSIASPDERQEQIDEGLLENLRSLGYVQ